MIWLWKFLGELWDLFTEMAPYLLFGFLAAGILHVLLRPRFVERILGAPGWKSNLKATVLGIPLPVCSCGVLPLAASLKREGASSGSTLAFLTATPQTGVDSILATHALMGPVFTGFRVGVAFICGWLTGTVADLLETGKVATSGGKAEGERSSGNAGGCDSPGGSCCQNEGPDSVAKETWGSKGKRALTYGFITLPEDIARALTVGLVLAAMLGVFMPTDWIEANLSNGWLTFFLMTVIAIPIYVCSTGSIPLAFAFMKVGISPGAALVFLIAGPATNAATLSVIWKQMGPKLLAGFLATLILCAWTAGWVLDQIPFSITLDSAHHHGNEVAFWFRQISGILLAGVLVWSQVAGKFGRPESSGEPAPNEV